MNIVIDDNEYYSPGFLVRHRIVPGFKSHVTLINWIKSEGGMELWKPVIRETNANQTRILVKGSTVKNILKLADEGKLVIKYGTIGENSTYST